MPKVIEVPKTVVQFPDSMSDAEIQKQLAKHVTSNAARIPTKGEQDNTKRLDDGLKAHGERLDAHETAMAEELTSVRDELKEALKRIAKLEDHALTGKKSVKTVKRDKDGRITHVVEE